MQHARLPENEAARVATLHSLNILDTPRDERFDRYTRLAARVFDAPIALISLIDETRQWFKSVEGFEATETPREISFCGHAILGDNVFEVRNTRRDPRFRDNPLVIEQPHIRYYAGAPLWVPGGYKLGTLCIIDRVPRQLSDADKAILKNLADMVVGEIYCDIDNKISVVNRRTLSVTGARLFDNVPDARGLSMVLFDIDAVFSPQAEADEQDSPASVFVNLLHEYFPAAEAIADIGNHRYCVLLKDDDEFDEVKATSRVCAEAKSVFRRLGRSDSPPVFVGRIHLDAKANVSFDEVLRDADGMFFKYVEQPSSDTRDYYGVLNSLLSWRKTIF